MSYRDARTTEDKLREHRYWNTLDVEHDSAAVKIAADFIAGLKSMKGSFSWTSLATAFSEARAAKDQAAIEGLVRLLIFCSRETPNRFKAQFPAFLVQSGRASQDDRCFSWPGSPKSKTSTIDVEKLVRLCAATEPSGERAVDDLIHWAREKIADRALNELVTAVPIQEALIECIAVRLAQGADTNTRGHGATGFIRNRLAEWGFDPTLGNTNATDVPVSELVSSYTGPRKYDTVIWDANNSVVVVGQSQMYTSDVGSIQGKTVEEDEKPNAALLKKYSDVVVLTHTEGFGCHTSMLSRLRHVLESNIHGFIQLRTLDYKLRHILHEVKCTSLLDFEIAISQQATSLDADDACRITQSLYSLQTTEVKKAWERYSARGDIKVASRTVSVAPERAPFIAYYCALDALAQKAVPINSLKGTVWRIGGLSIESGLLASTARQVLSAACQSLQSLQGIDIDDVAKLMMARRSVVEETI